MSRCLDCNARIPDGEQLCETHTAEAVARQAVARQNRGCIDWTKPIETVDGHPAKLVHVSDEMKTERRLVAYRVGFGNAAWVDEFGRFGTMPFIRNVPERVKLDGWIGIDWMGKDRRMTSIVHPSRSLVREGYKYLLNLALVSEKCPEAIEKCGGK